MTQLTYRLPQAVIADTMAFREAVKEFLSGQTSAEAFKAIRVPMGIYEQREDGTYMVRVRGAAGVFLPHQARLIAELSETYGSGIVHATTRQDLQIHGVKIDDTPAILERLLEVGLSSRGGGGNTVRNVSACPHAGICGNEIFDVTPYALAMTEYLIRERGNFSLPRKFKVAFSGCGRDCSLSSITDLGFFAHERDGVGGFSVYAAGGMGARSALGIQIEEFVPAEAIFEIAEAVKRVFDKHGDRTNRSKARLRFVLARLGEDEFRRTYREELDSVRREGIETAVVQELARKDGLFALNVHLQLGDIPASHLAALAEIASSLGDGTLRATQSQNLQLRVPETQVDDAMAALRGLNADLVRDRSVECVACAGAFICRTGLCSSRDLAGAIEARLADLSIPFEATIHISGCPNACGHHPISVLGLYGSLGRVDGKSVPFYTIVAGGRRAEGNAALAEPIAKIPADVVPELIREFWIAAAANRRDEETLYDLMSRWGISYLGELVKKTRERD